MMNSEKRRAIRAFVLSCTSKCSDGFVNKKELWSAFYRRFGDTAKVSRKEFFSLIDGIIYEQYEVPYRHDIHYHNSVVRGYRGIQVRNTLKEEQKVDGMKFVYEGIVYDVPCMPEKEWGEWMTSKMGCSVPYKGAEILCGHNTCRLSCDCIYRLRNCDAREAFYYECFPEEKSVEKPHCEKCANYKPKEESKKLPKLTQEVFERPDCPKWAKWAAVDPSGRGWWFEDKPFIPATPIVSWVTSWKCKEIPPITSPFDATDWEHSLIEREIRYVSCSSLKWPTMFKYSKLKDTYYVQIHEWAGPEWHIVGTTTAVDSVPFDVVDVTPEFKDPAALVGTKVKLVNPGNNYEDQIFMIVRAGHQNAQLGSTGIDYGIDSFVRDFVKLDGSLLCTFKEY